jgi:hypothetical protein
VTQWTFSESLAVADRIARVFESLEIPYAIGGSVASSLHGFPRSTMDIDLVAELSLKDVDAFVAAIERDFYVDRDRVRQSIEREDSFNIIELNLALKVDIFVRRTSPLSVSELKRAEEVTTEAGHRFVVAAPEDVVLQKLDWYHRGGRISERQWGDLLGVLEVQQGRLDMDYLHQWAAQLQLEELLAKALSEASGA